MIKVTRSAVIDAPIEQVWALIRDFNSHWAWHPVVGESHIENGEPSDQVGCVRNFHLKDGNHIREQLLSLSDEEHLSSYCILDATLPMTRYVATVQLKRVTDGERTFWHWQSSFDVPKGREREFDELVGKGVYEGGFDGARSYLRKARGAVWRPEQLPPMTGGSAGATVVGTTGVASGTTRESQYSALAQAAPITGHGIVAQSHGGADVLRYQTLNAPGPGPGEVRIRHTAIGVNYIDVYVRKGLYKMITPPAPLGMEAAGVVIDVGPGVGHLLPGDRVAYACPPPGSYVSVRTMPAEPVVVLPDDISDEAGACLMLKGMTAEYLLHRCYRVRAGDTVLVHAAAGGVGLFLCSWAKALGAQVIGTVSSEDKARLARAHGCDSTIIGSDYRFADEVKRLTAGRGANVVYDGLGAQAMQENLDALAFCGHWVSYGQASGALQSISLDLLSSKSLTLSRPVLFHYTMQRSVLNEIARNTFDALRQGRIKLDIRHRYPLAAAAQAHRDLEARATTGPIILLP